MNVQLATRIDSRTKAILDKLHKKTHVPIRQLTEKAIVLLDEHYRQLQQSYKGSSVNSDFMHLVDYSMKKYSKTYKKLAE